MKIEMPKLTGAQRAKHNTDMIVLCLMEEIVHADTLYHAQVAKDAIFHIRLVSKSVEKEAAKFDSQNAGLVEQTAS